MKLENVSARIGQMLAGLKSGLPPFQHRVLTVAIQGNSLRLVLLTRHRIVNWGHVPFNPAFLRNGFIANSQGISQVLQNTLASKRIPRVSTTAAFTGFQSLCQVINLPGKKDIVPREVIPREARRLMAYSEKEHYLFWQKVVIKPGQFIVVVVPRAPLQTFVETMKLAGLPLRRVELAPLALAKAAAQAQSIVANIERDSIDIVITIDSVPVVVRSLWIGDEPLDVDSAPRRLAEELVNTISYYNGANPETRLSPPLPIHLAGGFPVEELTSAVTQGTGHPVVAISPAFPVTEGFPASAMAVNLGLATSS